MSKLSKKRILSDAELVTTGPISRIASGDWLKPGDQEWYKGYVAAWEDIKMDIEAGNYDEGKK